MAADISIIIPTHRRAESLSICLNHLVNQTLDKNKYEIIIVNDGADFNTENTVKEYQAKYPNLISHIKQANHGPAAARNKGANAAVGDILFFLDDDCLAEKNVLNNILEEFNTFKNNEICIGGFSLPGKQNFIGQAIDLLCCYQGKKPNYVYNRQFLSTSNLCVRKSFFTTQGGFKEDMRCAEDSEWSYRARSKGCQLIKSPKIIVCHQHQRNTVKKLIKQAFEWGSNTNLEVFVAYKNLLKNEKSIESKLTYAIYNLLLAFPPGISATLLFFLAPFLATVDTLHSCVRLFGFRKKIVIASPIVFLRFMSLRYGHVAYFLKRRRINIHRKRKGFAEILFYNLNKHKLKTPPYLK